MKTNKASIFAAAAMFALVAIAVLSIGVNIAGAQYPYGEITASPAEILPGASVQVNMSFPNLQPYYGCNYDYFMINLAGPGQACPATSNYLYYCDVKQTGGLNQGTVPPFACSFPTTFVYNNINTKTGGVASTWVISGPTSGFSQFMYYTNHTLLQGTYTLCASVAEGCFSGFYYSYYTYSIGNVPIQVTNYDPQGPSYGVSVIAFGSNPTLAIMAANLITNSPYINYYNATGDYNPKTQIAPDLNCGSNGGQCFIEIGGGSSQQGCVSPINSIGAVQLPNCASSGPVTTPCLLPGSTSIYQYSAPLPSGLTGSYFMCAYDYNSPIVYPNSYNQESSPTELSTYPPTAPTLPGVAAPFYAAVTMQCTSGSCTSGPSFQAPQSRGAGGNLNGVGLVSLNPPEIGPGQNSIVDFKSEFISPGTTISLYTIPLPPTAKGYPAYISQCTAASLSTSMPVCNGKNSNGNGCYDVFDVQPGGSGNINCANDASQPNPPAGDSCTCQNIPIGSTQFTAGALCDINSANAETTQTISTTPGNYLECGVYTQPFQVPQIAALQLLTVIPNPVANGGQSPNVGVANTLPLQGELCTVYQTVIPVLIILAIALLVMGGAIYSASSIFTSQIRGTLRGYAVGMILGGAVGLIVTAIMFYVLSVTTGNTIAAIVANVNMVCP